VFCALLSWLSAKSKGGAWRLRIEDIDPDRSRRDFALQLMDDLQWLGLPWDGEVVWQSQRSDIYEHYLKLLDDAGLTYPCYCTRADIMATQAPHETDGRIVYAGTCRPKNLSRLSSSSRLSRQSRSSRLSSSSSLSSSSRNSPAAIRLLVPDEVIAFTDGHYGRQEVNLAKHCGDYILRRKDGAWAYQLAVVVDDALMGVTEIVRGRDLLLSTPQQIHLHQTIASFSPFHPFTLSPFYYHHPLLINENGQRLCKRNKSLDLSVLREKHNNPDEIVGFLACLAGIIPAPAPAKPQDLLPLFDWQKVPTDDILCQNQ
jgi:glutamyl-tRNA synthetase